MLYDITYIWTLKKKDTNELIYRTETYKFQKQTYGDQRGNVEGGINQKPGMNIHTPLFIRQRINKDLLYSTGNSTQNCVTTYVRRESKTE